MARLSPGETILVTGASGGVGSAAVQICSALGCRVLAVTSNADKVRRVSAWCGLSLPGDLSATVFRIPFYTRASLGAHSFPAHRQGLFVGVISVLRLLLLWTHQEPYLRELGASDVIVWDG